MLPTLATHPALLTPRVPELQSSTSRSLFAPTSRPLEFTLTFVFQVRLLVLPNLATYLELLREDLDPQKQKDEVRRYEAQRMYGLLQVRIARRTRCFSEGDVIGRPGRGGALPTFLGKVTSAGGLAGGSRCPCDSER